MSKIPQEIWDLIEECCASNLIESSVTPMILFNWLQNYPKDKWRLAMKIAAAIEYISETKIYGHFKDRIEELYKLAEEKKVEKVILIPAKASDRAKGIGKSGLHLIYYLEGAKKLLGRDLYEKGQVSNKKDVSNKFMPYQHVKEHIDKSEYLKSNRFLVIFDDYMGSGDQMINFINNEILLGNGTKTEEELEYLKKIKEVKKYILTLFSSEQAYSNVEKNLPDWKIITLKRKKAFNRRKSVFGSEFEMKKVRQFAYDEGKRFRIRNKDKSKGVEKYIPIPMGYGNTQELLVFSYRPPNNTLPIIWGSEYKDSKGKKQKWIPLFPRFVADRISQGKELRKGVTFLLFIAKKFELDEVVLNIDVESDKKYKYITQKELFLWCVIKLRIERHSMPLVCQKLSVSVSEYKEIVKNGVEREMLDEYDNPTQLGRDSYNKLVGYKTYLRGKLGDEFQNPNKTLYIPKYFKGGR